MSELPKAYNPKDVEEKWYDFWEKGGYFKASALSEKPPYCICMPPPNITGSLHMGHALVGTLQDVLIRWKRMCGYEALWIPGTDHAGIATQTIVEKQLIATYGKRRGDFSRNEFLDHVWKWKEQNEGKIIHQLRRLGSSCDWSRLCFTMDAPRCLAVRTAFKRLFDQGLIYRGDYLVNWDPLTQTALADDEVEYEERDSYLWHIRYPFTDNSGYITIATTRPETLFGDTALACSPQDERYKNIIGKTVRLPLTSREIPIIADHFVDKDFGTGIVKVTPAHDPNDYEIGMRHGLPFINIMTPDGRLNSEGKEYAGQKMEEARKEVVKALHNIGLLEGQEPHKHRVGVSYRSKAVIEPYLSKQWFVRMSGFKSTLKSAVSEKRVTLIPEHWESTYFHWIDNLRDWCISRQLVWGHQIPIWYHKNDPEKVLCYDGEGLPPEVEKEQDLWKQDEDVLDTWFSSALWPMSTLGWPESTQDLKVFYPNATLITGHDILFFWVARMILMGECMLESPPFHETFIHGLIYGRSYWRVQEDSSILYVTGKERLSYDLGEPTPSDIHAKWEKMSKTKGNIIDPIEIIESYGTDAMRMALCFSATHARQIDLDRRRFEEFKNFANKIWNGARFVLSNITLSPEKLSEDIDTKLLTIEDRWILSSLARLTQTVNTHLTNYGSDKAASAAYEFFWKEFCAYYVELVKPTLTGRAYTEAHKENKQKLLAIILCSSLRLLHPMAPFITEELFSLMKPKIDPEARAQDPHTQELIQALAAPACIVSPYPMPLTQDIDLQAEETFNFLYEIVYAARTIRGEMQIPPHIATDLFLSATPDELLSLEEHTPFFKALLRIGTLHYTEKPPQFPCAATTLVRTICLTIPLPEEMRSQEKVRLTKEKERLVHQYNLACTQLSNKEFAEKAPAALVEKTKKSLEHASKELELIASKLSALDPN